jgi:hypothetical protein
MPTLLSLCARPIPKTVEGLDFTSAMRRGRDPSGGVTLVRCLSPFGEFTRPGGGREYRAVRTAKHTYVRDLHGAWLLYDNEADPYQMHNLSGRAEARDLQTRLDRMLDAELKRRRSTTTFGPALNTSGSGLPGEYEWNRALHAMIRSWDHETHETHEKNTARDRLKFPA